MLVLATLAAATPAGATSTSAGNVCADPSVLGFITSRFGYKAVHYLQSDLSIYEIRRMRLTRQEPTNEYMSSVARDYCHASVTMTDGSTRPLWYLIEHGWGFAGIGRNIEFCIDGLDPWHVYGAYCASLR
ncbi:hypothetical protein [Sinorhizobium sp. BG8]|uniref:hypothetical protein n=1 Tax=Sinorhizobium sp. BG8 TaxID=2613773 RepID=UPI0032B15C87